MISMWNPENFKEGEVLALKSNPSQFGTLTRITRRYKSKGIVYGVGEFNLSLFMRIHNEKSGD